MHSAAETSYRDAIDWRQEAACKDQDTELFFPLGEGLLAQMQIREAKDVCLRCDVRRTCLAWAIEHKVHGIWGMTTDSERAEMVRTPKRKPGRPRKEAES